MKNSKNWDFPEYSICKLIYKDIFKLGNEISDLAKDLIKKLMCYDPDQRLSAKDALLHEWINNAPTKPIS